MIIPIGFFQVNLKFTGSDLPNGAEVTFGLEQTGGPYTPLEVCDAVEDALNDADSLFAATLSGADVTTIRVKKGPNATGPFAEKAVTISGTSVTNEGLPSAAYLVHKQTGFGGRAGRGRLYWPGAALSEVDAAGGVGNDARDGVTDGWELIRTQLTTAGLTPMLLHATDEPEPYVITAFSCDARVATQRRRLRS